MKAHEMRTLAGEELVNRLTGWEEDYFKARCEKAVGQLQDTSLVRKLRRNIARAKSILNEKTEDAASET